MTIHQYRKASRPSTTAKLTAKLCRMLSISCDEGDNPIIRIAGIEYGLMAVVKNIGSKGYSLLTWEGEVFPTSKATIRKTTVETLRRVGFRRMELSSEVA